MFQALLDEAYANMVDQKDQLARIKDLHDQKFSTHMEYVTRQQAYRWPRAKYDHAKAEFEMKKQGAWEFDKLVAKTAVEQAESQVRAGRNRNRAARRSARRPTAKCCK